MHFSPSCSVSFYTSFPLSLTLSQRDFGPRAEPPRQRFIPVYCLQQLSSTNEMLQVKHGWGLVPWLRLKSKPGKERSVQCLRWRSVWLSSGQKTPPPSYLLHTFPPSSSPSFPLLRHLLTVCLVVELGSQPGSCQVFVEGFVHLFALFWCEVVLPVPDLACSGTKYNMKNFFSGSFKIIKLYSVSASSHL